MWVAAQVPVKSVQSLLAEAHGVGRLALLKIDIDNSAIEAALLSATAQVNASSIRELNASHTAHCEPRGSLAPLCELA